MNEALEHLRRRDPVLKRVIAQVGDYGIKHYPPTFHALARTIVYQQLSGKAAATIFGRLQEGCGLRVLRPESLLAMDEARMRAAGVSSRKANYLKDLAEKTGAGLVRFGRHKKLSDEDVIAELTQVKGIGVWSAQMFLMFALRRPDVFPVLDLGVRNGMQRVYGLTADSPHADYEALAERWRPWRSVASWYMWRVLELPS
jgi:DNA-3-methyladenine glycosylase II